ncbi:4Fe-4S dicluster domain-containing protein [Salicibibacter cibarius]|uniref:4Fe-4S dicluster domain-containing protein n=1 Tax=Salicibibacter cibarius TaxID=2743000 RepID=A0A7T6Z588_9BACI|nr:(Fe-S)-binding protein [Salicibibacter cibarius]QQK77235.1 4Fe-4S dicluster domain-containing protein [Salicibibacter cibarius]
MEVRPFLMIVLGVLALAMLILFVLRVSPILRAMKNAKPDARWDQKGQRFASMMNQVFGHRKLLRFRLAGIIHLFIFSGFVVLFLDILEVTGQLVYPPFTVGVVLGGIIDVWVIITLAGVILALYQRRVMKPKRFEGSDERDATIILSMIATILVGIIIHTSFYHLLAGSVIPEPPFGDGHFLGLAVSQLWIALGIDTPMMAQIGYAVGVLLDLGMILIFLAYLPISKHSHVLFAIPAVFFRRMDIPEQSGPDFDRGEANGEGIKIATLADFSWKDTLDLFTCTECGRCQDVCPAYGAGLPLSPKKLILDLRDSMTEHLKNPAEVALAGPVISEETLWACTTCGACQEECPVYIEHVPKIVGMRSSLIESGSVEERAQGALENLIDQRNAYGENPDKRPKWQSKAPVQFKDARREAVDWLWFMGDVTSFDSEPNVLKSVQAISTILDRAGMDVGLLYDGESSSGNDELRMGEEGLFKKLAGQNLHEMKQATFSRILTSDPHSFNTLRNDYPKMGLEQPVYHYTQVILDLFKEGKLTVEQPVNAKVTFHDPCYLGRWNRIFDPPRDILRLCGAELVEMPRNRECSLCCGAGGGRMFMNETGMEERPSEERIREAVELNGVTQFVVSCPMDVVMYTAAAAALGYEDRIKVVDIAELVVQATGIKSIDAKAV